MTADPPRTPEPLPTKWPTRQGGGPWEQSQQQESGAQHAALVEVGALQGQRRGTCLGCSQVSRWAGSPGLGWAATLESRERGWRTEALLSELVSKACGD